MPPHKCFPHIEISIACYMRAGYNAKDLQVQVEDNQALILHFGNDTQNFHLPPDSCLEEINANWKEGVLTITVPKMQ